MRSWALTTHFDELTGLQGCLGRSKPFVRSRPESVVEFEGKIGVREGASLNLEAGRNADITLRRREARIRCQSALQRLGQRNRSRRPLRSFDWNCDNKQCAHQAQS